MRTPAAGVGGGTREAVTGGRRHGATMMTTRIHGISVGGGKIRCRFESRRGEGDQRTMGRTCSGGGMWQVGWLLAVAVMALRPVQGQVFADVQTTMGDFSVELFHDDVPRTVANFVRLADGTQPWLDPRTQQVRVGVPYYDGIIFHRVIPNFMIQGGSPRGDGTDGPGYKFPDEFSKQPNGELRHTHNAAGRLSMANSGAHTNGSQFFITTSVTPPAGFPVHLDDRHTVFGQVTAGPAGSAAQGQAVVDSIAAVPRDTNADPPSDRPITDVVIQSVRIRRLGASAEAFDPAAWVLPEVTGARTILSAASVPVAGSSATSSMDLVYERPPYQATAFHYSMDATNWEVLRVRGAVATPIVATADTSLITINGLAAIPDFFIRGRSIDYSGLISHTKPALTTAAEIRFQLSPSGSQVFTIRRTGESTATWHVDGPPAATGPVSNLGYTFGSGDGGFFSPHLTMDFPENRLPWPGGVTLGTLQVALTFNAQSTTSGYFSAAGFVSATSPTATGKGVFSVLAP